MFLEGNFEGGTFLHLTSLCCCPKTNLGNASNIVSSDLSICGVLWKSIINSVQITNFIPLFLNFVSMDIKFSLSNKVSVSDLRI